MSWRARSEEGPAEVRGAYGASANPGMERVPSPAILNGSGRAQTARTRAMVRRGSSLAVLVLSLAGCALLSPETVRQDLLAGRSPGRYIEGVPFIPQKEYYCGPASLAMVLRYWGEPIDQDEIARELYIDSIKGTLNFDLEFYARRRGYLAESFRGRLEQVKAEIDRGRPLIVFQDQGLGPLAFPHFFVIIGYDDAREVIVAHSGVTENRLIPYWEFLWTWGKKGNWTLRILPKGQGGPSAGGLGGAHW